MSKFMYVDYDDWVALYKDGKKVMEGHSLPLRDVFEILEADLEYEFVESGTPLGDYISENGCPPETVEEIREIQS